MSETLLQADWDFSWLSDKHVVTVARHYECAREAVIEADLALPNKRFPEPPLDELYFQHKWTPENNRYVLGPIWDFRFKWPGPRRFPLSPFQLFARELDDLAEFSRGLEFGWRMYHGKYDLVSIHVPAELSLEEATKYFAEEYTRHGYCLPQRGAGARVRQYKTALKYLGATRVLNHLSRQHGLSGNRRHLSSKAGHLTWSSLVAEAKVFTSEVLGEPLLGSDYEWAKAQRIIGEILGEYQPEIKFLRQIFRGRTDLEPMTPEALTQRQIEFNRRFNEEFPAAVKRFIEHLRVPRFNSSPQD
jgi:hypothetical protein